MAAITFNGLSSGLDTDSIVESLVNLKRQQLVTPLQSRAATATSKKAAVASISALVSSLKSAASNLKSSTIVNRASTSSNTDKLTIDSTESTAAAGTYDVLINDLATYDRVYFTGVANTGATTFGTGTFDITSNGVTKSVVIDSTNNTLNGIAEAINDVSGMEVTASIVNDGTTPNPYRLVLTSKDTGTVSNISNTINAILPTLSEDAALTTSNNATNASITVNSLTISKSTNTFTEAIPGVTFTVTQKEATTPVKVTISDDYSSTISQISSFVSSYNSLMTTYRSQFTYNESTESLGVLGADFAMHSSQQRIKNIVFEVYDALGISKYNSLSKLGISVDKTGKMALDTETLQDALEDNPNEIETLFQGTTTSDGLFEKLYDYTTDLTDSTDGLFTKKSDIYDDQIDELNKIIEDHEERITKYEANLKARFAHMEDVLSGLKAMEKQIQNFADSLSSLNGNS